jgi:hypothetical protein
MDSRSLIERGVRGAGLGLVSMIALGAAGCCGMLCAPCSFPPSTSSSPPPLPPLPSLPPLPGPASPSIPAAPVPVVGAIYTAEPTKTRDPGVSVSVAKVSLGGAFGAPIRGVLFEEAPGKTRFLPNHAVNIAPIGGGTLLVVHATTGLWLHETKSLTRLARLLPPVDEMATSPDGSLIAVAVGTGFGVIGYPDLTVKAVAIDIDLPHRMRFSPNGERVVIASYEDTVTLIEARTGVAQAYDTGQDVNDAIVMPDRPDEVAYASDEDEIIVYDMKAGRKVFGSAPLIDEYQRQGWGVFFERDQTAVACDPSTLRLIGGGDDNKVWRFDGLRSGSPTFLNPVDFDGNIREILCCSGGSYVVALDSTVVHLMSPTGVLGPSFKPSFGSLSYGPSRVAPIPVGSPPLGRDRIALLSGGSVLIAANGRAVRWEPASGTAIVSPDYNAAQIDARSSLTADSVFVACDGKRCAVARVVHAPAPAHEVEAAPVGDAEMERISSLLEFSDGSRALAGSHKGNLRFVFLAPGRGLEPPIDPPGLSPGGSFEQGGLAHGYLEPSGRVFEITSSPRSVTLVGRTATGTDGRRLEYDNAGGRWKVKLLDGTEESLSPP